MPNPLITDNTLVTATDWWNPLSQLANTVEANLATELTNRAAADTAINNRLNSTIALTGISDLPTWKTSVDGSITSHTNSINALNTAVGIPYGAGTSLSARTTALEAATGTPPYLHAYQLTGAVQSIANTTHTAITLTGEIRDTANTHSNVTNTSRCTPTTAGYYECWGIVVYAATAAGMCQTQFRKNGVQVLGAAPYGSRLATNQAALANTVECKATIQCNGTTDYIELWTWHTFGGATNTFSNGTDQQSTMIIRYVGP